MPRFKKIKIEENSAKRKEISGIPIEIKIVNKINTNKFNLV